MIVNPVNFSTGSAQGAGSAKPYTPYQGGAYQASGQNTAQPKAKPSLITRMLKRAVIALAIAAGAYLLNNKFSLVQKLIPESIQQNSIVSGVKTGFNFLIGLFGKLKPAA